MLSLKCGRETPLGRLCYFQSYTEEGVILLWYYTLKKKLRKVKEAERMEKEREKRALGNLLPHLVGTSASLFLSLTSLTFNCCSQFAGRETPRWQEMKPPQLLNTHLPHSIGLLLLSIPSSILLSPVSLHIKGKEEKPGDSLDRLFASLLFILCRVLPPPSCYSGVSVLSQLCV